MDILILYRYITIHTHIYIYIYIYIHIYVYTYIYDWNIIENILVVGCVGLICSAPEIGDFPLSLVPATRNGHQESGIIFLASE